MKATGIVRNLDELGRVVIPKELRDVLGIAIKDPIEIFTDENFIALKKYHRGCLFCGSMDDAVFFKGHFVCKKCRAEL